MSKAPDSICFYCSQSFQLDGRLNRTQDGRPCPICAERLLDALPPLIPTEPWADERDEAPAGSQVEGREAQQRPQLRAVRPEPRASRRRAAPVDDRPEPA